MPGILVHGLAKLVHGGIDSGSSTEIYEVNAPFKVNISGASTGNITAQRWDFEGDNIFDRESSGENEFFSHTYFYPGTYMLTLEVENTYGLTDKMVKAVYVKGDVITNSITVVEPENDETIAGNSVTLMAKASSKIDDNAEIFFQIKEESKVNWTNIPAKKIRNKYAANMDTTTIINNSDGLTYLLKVVATLDNETIMESITISIFINNSEYGFSKNEGKKAFGNRNKTEKIYKNITNEIIVYDNDDDSVNSVIIPPNILNDLDDLLELNILSNLPANIPDIDSDDHKSASIFREYNLTSGQTQFTSNVTLTISYSDLNNDGLVDESGLDERKLVVFWYNGTTALWEVVPGSVVFPDSNYVEVPTNHFSIYGLGSIIKAESNDIITDENQNTDTTPNPVGGDPVTEPISGLSPEGGGGAGGCFISNF